ncbi:MAG: hypothetical protein QW474_03035 [Candidatus Aenigmatarchaeota archaeon]
MLWLIIILLSFRQVAAVCPLCTVAVGVGVGLTRYFGIDDLITGTWIGALIISSSLWIIDWFEKKKIKFFAMKQIVIASFYLIVLLPLYFSGFIGHPGNTILGVDKILLGCLLGTMTFIKAILADKYLRKLNKNKVLFPYQKVVIPIVFLIISSIIIYLLLGILS